jgi:hypothetical protein
MKEATREEFFDFVGDKDLCVSVDNAYKYPYTSLFKTRGGNLEAKIIDSYTDGIEHRDPIIRKYYINN